MQTVLPKSDSDVERLRAANYNATVTEFRRVHQDLAIMRVRPDNARIEYEPGQYTVLGLGFWEPRLPDVQDEVIPPESATKLIRRAYSISCRLVDTSGRLTCSTQDRDLEFYVALVRFADHSPSLTPRLFMLGEGDRLFLGPKCHGRYTLERLQPDDDVLFLATGTGEAPHNAMIAKLLGSNHLGRIASVVCTRYRRDLAYEPQHRQLEHMFGNYRYLTLTTRESRGGSLSTSAQSGKRYIQDYFRSGDLERDSHIRLDPRTAHVFLCGNPNMIGLPTTWHNLPECFPQPTGMIELLHERGFYLSRPHSPGRVHFEKYW